MWKHPTDRFGVQFECDIVHPDAGRFGKLHPNPHPISFAYFVLGIVGHQHSPVKLDHFIFQCVHCAEVEDV